MKINYNLFLNYTGYSIAAQEYILALKNIDPDVDIKCKFYNKPYLGVSNNRVQQFLALQGKEQDCIDRVNIFHSVPQKFKRPARSLKNIGICIFETLNIPQEWVTLMNRMDAIITASQFNAGVFKTHGVKIPIHVIPHCFDPKMFHKDVSESGRYAKTTILAMGTWRQRKNWPLLIKGFYEAFEDKDNVCLLIKTDHTEFLRKTVEVIKSTTKWKSKNTAPIYTESKGICSFEDIPRLMKKADIYVSPSMGEGFGLSGLHAMALGIPVVTTKYGGCLEYAKPDLCNYFEPLKYERIANVDGFPQFRNAIWPIITVEEIATKLREAVRSYPKEKVEKAYNYVHENFCYLTVGQKFLEVLQ